MTVLTYLGVTINAAGASAPAFSDILDTLNSTYLGIFGQDTYLGNDAQDEQFIVAIARGINDVNAGTMAAYNARSPATAQGNGLSAAVKINGLTRLVAGFSTAQCAIVGQANRTITNGSVRDTNGNIWALPASVTIPNSGTITVTVTCTSLGAVNASAGAVAINTPTFGWQSASFAAAATPGAPIERDPALRIRQQQSTSLPALCITDSIVASLEAISGIGRVIALENTTTGTVNGMPPGSVQFIVENGLAAGIEAQLVNAIGIKINPGAMLVGSQTPTYTSPRGSTKLIPFNVSTPANINFTFTLTTYPGWTASMEAQINAALAAYLLTIPIGGEIDYSRIPNICYANSGVGAFFKITAWTIQKNSGSAGSADIVCNYNEAPVFGVAAYSGTGT